MKILDELFEMSDEIISNRRTLHKNPELGFELENTVKFVKEKLKSYGITPIDCGKSGVVATVGSGSPVILLRADMDSLPMMEETNLSFKSTNGAMHSCGHDAHTAMLLAAAKVLKSHEDELKGTVKFMFQAAEELLAGASDMIDAGVLENPKVDFAFAQHIMSGEEINKIGHVYISRGAASTSADAYIIEIEGKQAHGSTPEKGIDAVIIACHIAIGLQTILAREISSSEDCVLLVGKIEGGATVNTTAGSAKLHVSIRTKNSEVREFVNRRVAEIANGIATSYRASANLIHNMQAPSVMSDEKMVDELSSGIAELVGEDKVHIIGAMSGTEDFSYVTEKVKGMFLQLGAGSPDEGYHYNNHNPKFDIDESTLHKGAAIYVKVAMDYLNNRA